MTTGTSCTSECPRTEPSAGTLVPLACTVRLLSSPLTGWHSMKPDGGPLPLSRPPDMRGGQLRQVMLLPNISVWVKPRHQLIPPGRPPQPQWIMQWAETAPQSHHQRRSSTLERVKDCADQEDLVIRARKSWTTAKAYDVGMARKDGLVLYRGRSMAILMANSDTTLWIPSMTLWSLATQANGRPNQLGKLTTSGGQDGSLYSEYPRAVTCVTARRTTQTPSWKAHAYCWRVVLLCALRVAGMIVGVVMGCNRYSGVIKGVWGIEESSLIVR